MYESELYPFLNSLTCLEMYLLHLHIRLYRKPSEKAYAIKPHCDGLVIIHFDLKVQEQYLQLAWFSDILRFR